MNRTLNWNGVVLQGSTGQADPNEVREAAEYARRHRTSGGPFDIVAGGAVPAADADEVAEYEAAGATWWLECLWDWGEDEDAVIERIRSGPPRES